MGRTLWQTQEETSSTEVAVTVSKPVKDNSSEVTPNGITVTRCGRQINKPVRFRVVNIPGSVQGKEGEVVRSRE